MENLVYILLIITSIIGLTFIVERGLALRWRKVVPPEIEAAVESCQTREDVAVLRRICEQHPAPLGRLLLSAIEHLEWPKMENEDSLQTRARHEIVKLERGLVVLEIIIGIAPLLGLVGTIVGMISVFGDVGQSGLTDAAKLAQGISLILRATLIGLLIAIPSLIAWSYYTKKVEMLAVEMETFCGEFLGRQYREEKKYDMRFHIHKRRGAPGIIIVALIDVLIVLLIFLMVTTTFKQQPALKLALPESSQALKSGANENPPLVVSIDKDGNLRLGTESVPVTADNLKRDLLARAEKDPNLKLAISADKAAPFGQIVRVMDAAKEAKIKMVNAFTKEAAKP